VENVHLSAREKDDNIVFMHRIEPGPASQSYGIQVARLAGIPDDVIQLARQELKLLESGSHKLAQLSSQATSVSGKEVSSTEGTEPSTSNPANFELFSQSNHPALQKLGEIAADDLTPKQALGLVYQLKNLLD
jgi:DNA mismatch repair protein MutS